MMNFQQLLQSLAKGEQPDLSPLIKRRSNGPPAVQLTPSQTAVSNILQPAEESMTIADINRGETPSGGNPATFSSADLKGLAPPNQTGRAVKGALGGIATGIHNSMASAQPIAPAAFDLDPGYESRRSALMPRFGDGGGTDPNADEVIRARPGSGVDIQPVNNALAQSPDFSRALSAEQPDQQQPDQQQSDTVQPTPQASDPNAPNFDNFGWNSDSPEMKAQRENDLNREPTLDELRAKYMQDSEVHSNKWKDALFGALTGVNHAVNGGPRETRTYSEIKRDRRLAPDAEKLAFAEGQAKYDQESKLKQSQIDWNTARPDIEREKTQQRKDATDAVTRRLQMNLDFRAGKAKPFIDQNGKVWKEFPNDPKRPMEPVENPITHEQEYVPGEEGIQWADPNTGKTITIKAKQSVMPDATIAAGNANRQQSANKDNAEKAWQTDKENINNHIQYQGQVNSLLTAAITAAGSDPDLTGANDRLTQISDELNTLYNSPLSANPDDQAAVEKAQKERVERVNKLVDEGKEVREKALNALGKSDAGKQKAAEIRAQIKQLKAPQTLTYAPYKPVQVGGGVTGKPVPKSKDPLGLFQ